MAAAASANAAQMIDPNNGYAFVDPTYAALAMQVINLISSHWLIIFKLDATL